MISLAEASSYFDRTEALDADSGKLLFLCQLAPYDDSRRDSGSAYRRVMSVAPGTVMPAALSISIFGQVWLIGNKEIDGLEEMHRDKYVLQPSPSQLKVSRLPGFLAGTVATTRWACLEWAKDAKELEVSSNQPQEYYAYFPTGADVGIFDIVWQTGSAYLVRAVHPQASGYLRADCEKLDQALPAAAQITTRAYSASAGAYTAAAPVTVNALRVRWQSLYLYGSQADARFQEGDCSIVLPAATPIATSSGLSLAGASWQVLSVETLGGATVAHARPT